MGDHHVQLRQRDGSGADARAECRRNQRRTAQSNVNFGTVGYWDTTARSDFLPPISARGRASPLAHLAAANPNCAHLQGLVGLQNEASKAGLTPRPPAKGQVVVSVVLGNEEGEYKTTSRGAFKAHRFVSNQTKTDTDRRELRHDASPKVQRLLAGCGALAVR